MNLDEDGFITIPQWLLAAFSSICCFATSVQTGQSFSHADLNIIIRTCYTSHLDLNRPWHCTKCLLHHLVCLVSFNSCQSVCMATVHYLLISMHPGTWGRAVFALFGLSSNCPTWGNRAWILARSPNDSRATICGLEDRCRLRVRSHAPAGKRRGRGRHPHSTPDTKMGIFRVSEC